MHELFRKCQGGVSAVLRRGWQGTWDDVRNTLSSELTLLEDHGRELVNRAARVREVAKERALQELRELWGVIAGLREKIDSAAAWLKGFWENWEHRAKSEMSRLLVLAVLATLPPPVAAGAVVIALSPACTVTSRSPAPLAPGASAVRV